MEVSDSYLVVERMIHAGEISRSELEKLLDSLEKQGALTMAEREVLLELAWKVNTDHPAAS